MPARETFWAISMIADGHTTDDADLFRQEADAGIFPASARIYLAL